MGSILYKLSENGFDVLDDPARRKVLDRLKQLEYEGYEFEAADGSFELLVRQEQQPDVQIFEVLSHQVISDARGSVATVNLKIMELLRSATAQGRGPLEALNLALRQCLSKLYPLVAEVELTDYKVRVLDFKKGAQSRVRVLVEWSHELKSWATMGVSEDVVEASWLAVVGALRLELMRLVDKDNPMGASLLREQLSRKNPVGSRPRQT